MADATLAASTGLPLGWAVREAAALEQKTAADAHSSVAGDDGSVGPSLDAAPVPVEAVVAGGLS